MATKQQKNLTIDKKIAREFKQVCEDNDLKESHVIEKMMEKFIVNKQTNFYDDIHASRINEMISRTIQKEIERVIKINQVLRKDVKALQAAVPATIQKNMNIVHNSLENVLRPELLDPKRVKLSDTFILEKDGADLIGKMYLLANAYEKLSKEKEKANYQKA